MEDIVLIRLLFVAGLFGLSGTALVSAYVIARLGRRGRARVGRAVPRQIMTGIPVRGTR
ncbi:MAG TPA: hypothetical protein VIE41_07630 [Methylomirabilota bacterium]|jgi:hypothetical protein